MGGPIFRYDTMAPEKWEKATYKITFYTATAAGDITIEKTIDFTQGDELEFTRLFYDYSDNLLIIQINNQKAFNVMEPTAIPDVAPMIDSSRTMVPLRVRQNRSARRFTGTAHIG